MSFKCKIGLHSWNGCKCSECEKTRNLQHDCLEDCEKCSKCGKVLTNAHKWKGGKCYKCGKTREFLKIGNQEWMAENLNVSSYRNGDEIPQVQDKDKWKKLTTGAWCYYENIIENGTTYGKLYNWYAVNDPRGLAPEDCHIPSNADWTTLAEFLGGENVAGAKMKSASGWANNGNGSNTSGFEGLPGGDWFGVGIGYFGYWWSSDAVSSSKAWSRSLYSNYNSLIRDNFDKSNGYSVRCLRGINTTFSGQKSSIEKADISSVNFTIVSPISEFDRNKDKDQPLFVHDECQPHPAAPHISTTKKIYKASNKEVALEFLRKQNITEPFYYIEIDTPAGRFGIDNGGRIYDKNGQFIEPVSEPIKVSYDTETLNIKSMLEIAMQNEGLQLPNKLLEKKENNLRCLRVIIEDNSADFYLRRMAIWWGSQFKDASFNSFLKTRFVDGKTRQSLYQKTQSSKSEMAYAEEGLNIASVDVLSGSWKP